MNIDSSSKKRLFKLIKNTSLLVCVGLLYYVFFRITGIGIPCLIKLITGKYCPGCGLSRMLIALLHLDFVSAAKYNFLLFALLPVGLIFGARKAYIYVKTGDSSTDKTEQIVIIIIFVLTVLFWILRNTETFSYLAPSTVI